MKKSIINLFMAVAVSLGAATVVVAQDKTIALRYCEEVINANMGEEYSNELFEMSAAIHIEASMLERLKGNVISRVSIGIANGTGDCPVNECKDISVWIRRAKDGNNLCTQPVASVKLGEWNHIILENPYAIDGEEIYVGYTLTANSAPIGCDGEIPGDKRASWLKINDRAWGSYTGSGNICIKAYVTGENLPQHDLSLDNILVPEFVKPGESFNVAGFVTNQGIGTITSFDAVCKSGETVLGKKTISGVNIPQEGFASFKIENIMFNEEGSENLEIVVENLNGTHEDQDRKNNLLAFTTLCTNQCVPRKVLMEHFTSLNCPKCPAGLKILKEAVEGYENRVVWASHHVAFQKDVYTLEESNNMVNFFRSYSTYNPAVMFDRTNLKALGATSLGLPSKGPVFEIKSVEYIQELLKESLSKYSSIGDLNIKQEYESSDVLKITVTGKRYQVMENELSLSLFLTEDGLRGTGIEKEDHVIRAIVNKAPYYGDALKFNTENEFTATYRVTLKKGWKRANMKVIAAVNNVDQTDFDNFKVYNAEAVALLDNGSGVENNSSVNDIQVYGHNGKIYVEGDYTGFQVYTIEGKQTCNENLTAGVYIVRVINDKKAVIKKIKL